MRVAASGGETKIDDGARHLARGDQWPCDAGTSSPAASISWITN